MRGLQSVRPLQIPLLSALSQRNTTFFIVTPYPRKDPHLILWPPLVDTGSTASLKLITLGMGFYQGHTNQVRTKDRRK